MSRFLRLLAALVALTLLAAACGGDSDDSSDGDEAATEADDSVATTEASTDEAASTTEAAADVSSASDDGDDEEASFSGSGGAWCNTAERIDQQFDAIDDDPFSVFSEEGFGQFRDAFDAALRNPPSEIAGDLATLDEGYDQFQTILEGANYDLLSLSEADLAALDTDEFNDAGDRVEAYLEDVCGFDPDDVDLDGDDDLGEVDAGEDSGDAPSQETLREQLVDQLSSSLGVSAEEADCLVDALDFEGISADPDAASEALGGDLFGALDQCGIDPLALVGGDS